METSSVNNKGSSDPWYRYIASFILVFFNFPHQRLLFSVGRYCTCLLSLFWRLFVYAIRNGESFKFIFVFQFLVYFCILAFVYWQITLTVFLHMFDDHMVFLNFPVITVNYIDWFFSMLKQSHISAINSFGQDIK